MKFLRRHGGKTRPQIKAHLVAKNAQSPRARTIPFFHAFIENMAYQLEILPHDFFAPRSGLGTESEDEIPTGLIVLFEFEEPSFFGIFEQIIKAAVSVEGLGEVRFLALDRLLDHRTPEVLVPLAEKGLGRFQDEVESIFLRSGLIGLGHIF